MNEAESMADNLGSAVEDMLTGGVSGLVNNTLPDGSSAVADASGIVGGPTGGIFSGLQTAAQASIDATTADISAAIPSATSLLGGSFIVIIILVLVLLIMGKVQTL